MAVMQEQTQELKGDGESMEESIGMKAAGDSGEQMDTDAHAGERKPFAEPELTRHEPLTNITLFTSGGNVAGAAFF